MHRGTTTNILVTTVPALTHLWQQNATHWDHKYQSRTTSIHLPFAQFTSLWYIFCIIVELKEKKKKKKKRRVTAWCTDKDRPKICHVARPFTWMPCKVITTMFRVVSYGCKTWSLTLREESRLRVFENRVLRRIFGPKRNQVTGEWRRLHNEERYAVYSSPNITWVIRSRRLRWAGHVARIGPGEMQTGFLWETWEKETTWKTQAYIG